MLKRAYIEITNVCNLNCDFCHGTKRTPQYMSLREFDCITNRFEGKTKYLYLHVLGEPLLHKDLGKILDMAYQKGFLVCLTTNGTHLPDCTEMLCVSKGLYKISISVHCYEGNHLKETLNEYINSVWDAVEKISETGTYCSLRLWNQHGNNQRNEEIYHILESRIHRNLNDCAKDRMGNIKLKDGIYLEMGEKFSWPDTKEEEKETQYCYALKDQIAVLVDGTVVPCCLDADAGMALGNLLQESLEEIYAKERTQKIITGFQRRMPCEELCKKCGFATRFNK